jgi:endonuclease VIII
MVVYRRYPVPEGHTIRRLALDHERAFARTSVRVTSPQGRFTAGAALIDGAMLTGVDAYGKHLLYDFGAGRLIHVHLGLYGKFTSGVVPAPAPRGAVRLRLENLESYADLRGPTTCEIINPQEHSALLARLGPDPLRPDSDAALAGERVRRSRAPVAALLMNQAVLAGVGNVYRAETLFRCGIDPYLPGRELASGKWEFLWADLRTLMAAGVRANRIVTTRPIDRSRSQGKATRSDAHYVYRRVGLPCRRCDSSVQSAVLAARNLFWCPTCQSPGAGAVST